MKKIIFICIFTGCLILSGCAQEEKDVSLHVPIDALGQEQQAPVHIEPPIQATSSSDITSENIVEDSNRDAMGSQQSNYQPPKRLLPPSSVKIPSGIYKMAGGLWLEEVNGQLTLAPWPYNGEDTYEINPAHFGMCKGDLVSMTFAYIQITSRDDGTILSWDIIDPVSEKSVINLSPDDAIQYFLPGFGQAKESDIVFNVDDTISLSTLELETKYMLSASENSASFYFVNDTGKTLVALNDYSHPSSAMSQDYIAARSLWHSQPLFEFFRAASETPTTLYFCEMKSDHIAFASLRTSYVSTILQDNTFTNKFIYNDTDEEVFVALLERGNDGKMHVINVASIAPGELVDANRPHSSQMMHIFTTEPDIGMIIE